MKTILSLLLMVAFLGACTSSSKSEETSDVEEVVNEIEATKIEASEITTDSVGVAIDSVEVGTN